MEKLPKFNPEKNQLIFFYFNTKRRILFLK